MADEVKEVKKDEDWMQKKWRPAMGWMYMGICTLDMGIFPILWSILQASLGQPVTQWQPLTLQGAGLFHVAMGAVLGIAAFGRTQEKLAGASSNAQPAALPAASSVPAPAGFPAPTFGTAAPTPMVKPTPMAAAPAAAFGGGFGLDPSDPQTRNTRND